MKNMILCKSIILVVALLFTSLIPLKAQVLPATIYGGSDDEQAYCVIEAINLDGYVMAGWTKSYGIGTPGFSNVYVVKTDSFGVPQAAFASMGAFDEEAHSLTYTFDGGYAMTGWTKSFGLFPGDSTDIFIVKTDSLGVVQWGFVYGTPFCEEAYSIIQTMDGGYAVTGWTNVPTMYPSTPPNVFLFRVDSVGLPMWTGIYWFPINLIDEGYSICEIPGLDSTDSYLIAGRANIFDATNYDAFVMQLHVGGMPLGLASVVGGIPGPGFDDEAYSVLWGGTHFIAAGWSNSFTAGGDDNIIVWEDDTVVGTPAIAANHYGWTDDERVMDDRSLVGIPGNWQVSGWTKSVGPGIPDPNFLIIAYDTNGLYGRVHPSAPGENDEQAYPMAITSKGYAIAGFTNSSWSLGGDDFHLLTLDPALNRPVCVIDTPPPVEEITVLEEGFSGEPLYFDMFDPFLLEEVSVDFVDICSIIPGITELPTEVYPADIKLYASFEQVTLKINKSGRLNMNLYDVMGRHVVLLGHGFYEKGTHIFTIPKSMSAGVYFVRADFEGAGANTKVVKYR